MVRVGEGNVTRQLALCPRTNLTFDKMSATKALHQGPSGHFIENNLLSAASVSYPLFSLTFRLFVRVRELLQEIAKSWQKYTE